MPPRLGATQLRAAGDVKVSYRPGHMLFALMPDSWQPVKSLPDRIVFPARGLYAACKVMFVAPRCQPTL
jgi:hypothetical protein